LKVIFSRKGFDTTSGGAPSPIIDGIPISLPIPTGRYPSVSTYAALGLGDILSKVQTKSTVDDLCHDDPMFWEGKCALGQTSTSQSHLEKRQVGIGDVFLFFGLFEDLGSNDRHHRIFSYLRVEKVQRIGCHPSGDEAGSTPRKHPHTIGRWDAKNTIYLGHGRKAKKADKLLRLTKDGGGPVSHWRIPQWLRETELTYHRQDERWSEKGALHVVGRGQEFVADIGERPEPKEWLDRMIAAIETRT
jgi:Nucleotide modification associated domain 3